MNNGSYEGDVPGAPRYTESRLDVLAKYMLAGIDNNAVPMVPNYSETMQEPTVLPSVFPNILCNGNYGIAVGYTTNMPSHQLGEVVDAISATIDNPNISVKELMKYIKGPDFNIGSILINNDQIQQLYETGKGKLTFKAKYHIQDNPNGTQSIVITQLPPEVNKQTIIDDIYKLCLEQKKIPRVANIRDLSTDIDHISIIIDLQKAAMTDLVVQQLFEKTQLTHSVSYIMRALKNNTPKLFSLKEIIDCYIEHRQKCIISEYTTLVNNKKKKLHITKGIFEITKDIHKAIKIIENADNDEIAKAKLCKDFNIDEEQAEAILEFKLRRLTKLNKNEIVDKIKTLEEEISKYNELLNEKSKLNELIKSQLQEIKDKFNDVRKTEIINSKTVTLTKDVTVVLTNKGNILQFDNDTFNTMLSNEILKEKTDTFNSYLRCSTDDLFLLLLENCTYIKTDFNGLLTSKPAKVIQIMKYEPDKKMLLMTSKGLVQKVAMSAFKAKSFNVTNIYKTVEEGSTLLPARMINGDDDIVTVITSNGLLHRFHANSFKDVVSVGGKGLAGINLSNNDNVIFFDVSAEDKKIVLFCSFENGLFGAKLMDLKEFTVKGRIAKGAIAAAFYKKQPGKLLSAVIPADNSFNVIDAKGKLIKCDISNFELSTRQDKMKPINFTISSLDF